MMSPVRTVDAPPPACLDWPPSPAHQQLVPRAKTCMNPVLPRTIACVLAVALATAEVAAPNAAFAANRAVDKAEARQAEVVAAQAKQAFKDRQFEYAARLFMKAYAISKEPALVFNAARAYEEAGKSGDACSLFRLYATISDDPDGIADAWARIKRLEGKGEPAAPAAEKPAMAKSSEPKPPVAEKPPMAKPSEPKPAESGPVGGGAVQSKPMEAQPVHPQLPDAKQVVPLETVAAKPSPAVDRTWAWAATGGAAVLMGGGAALAWLGAQKTREANQLPLHSQGDIAAYNSTFDRAELLTNAGISLLAVGVVTGGAAAWLHLRSRVAVSAGPDGRGGVWLAGRW